MPKGKAAGTKRNLPDAKFNGKTGATGLVASMIRIGRWVVAILLLLMPPILYGAANIQSNTADVAQWLPQNRPERQKYDQFVTRFGDDQFLAVSWPGCTLNDPRMSEFAAELEMRNAALDKPLIRSIATPAKLVRTLRERPISLRLDQATKRLKGSMIGPDGVTLALLKLSAEGTNRHADSIELVLAAAKESVNLSREQLRLGGGVYEAVMIDETSQRSLTRFVIPSSIAAFLVAWICIRNFRYMVVALAISAYCQITAVALVYYLGGELNAVLIVLPNLIFMLTLSAAVHLVNYYRDAGNGSTPTAGNEAVRIGAKPCSLAALTTAIGLGSLMASDLRPVSRFGFYCAVALVLATCILLGSFAFLISIRATDTRKVQRSNRSLLDRHVTSAKKAIGCFVLDNAHLVTFAGITLLMVVGWGTTRLTSTVETENLFRPESEIIRNYKWIEKNVGPLVPIEVVVSFPSRTQLDLLDQVRFVKTVQRLAGRVPDVGGIISAATYTPIFPQGKDLGSKFRRDVFRNRLEKSASLMIEKGLLAIENGNHHWRITARVPAIHELDYGQATEKVRQFIEPCFEQPSNIGNAKLTITGLSPVFYEAQQLLLSDLNKSFLLAFFLITPVMIVMLRGLWAGCLAMIPNLTPIILVFGVLGWSGIPLDIAGILTASVALGIAVDDTLHFVTWFLRARHWGLSARAGVAFAYRRCASAMLQTTLICCAAMLVYLPTEFLPTRKFAILMSLMLVGALAGDLILFPAILAGPMGRLVQIRTNPSRV